MFAFSKKQKNLHKIILRKQKILLDNKINYCCMSEFMLVCVEVYHVSTSCFLLCNHALLCLSSDPAYQQRVPSLDGGEGASEHMVFGAIDDSSTGECWFCIICNFNFKFFR